MQDGEIHPRRAGLPASARGSARRTRAALGHILTLLFVLTLDPGHAEAAPAPETPAQLEMKVKAAYLVRFISYVEWPAEAFDSPEDPLVIGILGPETLERKPEEIVQTGVGTGAGRPIVVRRFEEIDQVENCHLVYFPQGSRVTEELLQALYASHTLTIGEEEDFLNRGGILRLVKIEKNIRFQVNLSAAKAANLEISVRMLEIALDVFRPSSGRRGQRRP
jgi:hypothetical protein